MTSKYYTTDCSPNAKEQMYPYSRDYLSQVIKLRISKGGTVWHYVLPDVTQCGAYSIYEVFLPKNQFNLNVIKPLDLTSSLQKCRVKRDKLNNPIRKQAEKSRTWDSLHNKSLFTVFP